MEIRKIRHHISYIYISRRIMYTRNFKTFTVEKHWFIVNQFGILNVFFFIKIRKQTSIVGRWMCEITLPYKTNENNSERFISRGTKYVWNVKNESRLMLGKCRNLVLKRINLQRHRFMTLNWRNWTGSKWERERGGGRDTNIRDRHTQFTDREKNVTNSNKIYTYNMYTYPHWYLGI